jgi:hypothetical protein
MIHYTGCFKGIGKMRPLLSFAWERDWNEETRDLLEAEKKSYKRDRGVGSFRVFNPLF